MRDTHWSKEHVRRHVSYARAVFVDDGVWTLHLSFVSLTPVRSSLGTLRAVPALVTVV